MDNTDYSRSLSVGDFRIYDEDYKAAASVNGRTALYTQAGEQHSPVTIFESIFKQIIQEGFK